jgi:hypothetical protein
VRQKYGENLIVIRALTESGSQAVMKVEVATDGEVSRAYVQQARCRALNMKITTSVDSFLEK